MEKANDTQHWTTRNGTSNSQSSSEMPQQLYEVLSRLSTNGVGKREDCKRGITKIIFRLEPEEECCELGPLSKNRPQAEDSYLFKPSEVSLALEIQSFQPTKQLSREFEDALSIELYDICWYLNLHPFKDSLCVECSKRLLQELFEQESFGQKHLLLNHIIKFLCTLVLGSIKSRLGDTVELSSRCNDPKSSEFEIELKYSESTQKVSPEKVCTLWIEFNFEKVKECEKKLIEKILDTKNNRKAIVFVLFDQLQVSLQRSSRSDTLPSSNASMISISFQGKNIRLKIFTFDCDQSEFYYTYTVDGTDKMRERDHYKQDEILNAVIEAYISNGLSCDLTIVCIPCRSSLWFYYSLQPPEESSEEKLVEQLCELAAEGNVTELRKEKASAVNTPCQKYRNRTPLLCAAAAATFRPFSRGAEGHTACAKELISWGADVNAKDSKGLSVLHCAVNSANNSLLRFLLDTSKMKEGKEAKRPRLEYKEVDCNCQTNDGWTALMIAARSDNAEAAELLLKSGAEIDIENSDGETAEHICGKMAQKDACECHKVLKVIRKWHSDCPSSGWSR